jgi:hypothetical protein
MTGSSFSGLRRLCCSGARGRPGRRGRHERTTKQRLDQAQPHGVLSSVRCRERPGLRRRVGPEEAAACSLSVDPARDRLLRQHADPREMGSSLWSSAPSCGSWDRWDARLTVLVARRRGTRTGLGSSAWRQRVMTALRAFVSAGREVHPAPAIPSGDGCGLTQGLTVAIRRAHRRRSVPHDIAGAARRPRRLGWS